MKLKYDLFDMVSISIMNSEPMVIVEGKDDYSIYQTIANSINPQIQVYQVNEFENYEQGCTGVIKCMEVLQPKFGERTDNINKILGIIDRDARYYRGEIPNLIGLFMTKYYSIETYFATQENLRKLIAKMSFLIHQDVNEDVTDFVQSDFHRSIDTLYLLSLEALKNAVVRDYDSKLGYDDSPNKIAAPHFLSAVLPELMAKKADLEAFSTLFDVSIRDIKFIAKGKWYLHWFVNQTYPKIRELKERCRNERISQCRSCKVGNYGDCLFKTRQENHNLEVLKDDLLTFIDVAECQDIIEVFARLN
jgi:Protein of unknown function (DUF4435)